jgi:hypothetical protein
MEFGVGPRRQDVADSAHLGSVGTSQRDLRLLKVDGSDVQNLGVRLERSGEWRLWNPLGPQT